VTAVDMAEVLVAGPLAAQVAIFWDREGRDKAHLSKGAHGGAEAAMWCGLDGAGEDVTMAPMEYRAPGDPGVGRFRLHMNEVCGDCMVRFCEWERKPSR